MEKERMQNGYMIQLYQYARRYRYNYGDCISYFNYLIDYPEHNGKPAEETKEETDSNACHYIVFGEFDMLEIIPVDSFRKYHDVSGLAKKHLGRRQNVLLYSIGDVNEQKIKFNTKDKCWCYRVPDEKTIQKRFFCLSLLSVTNEVLAEINIFQLLPEIRGKILSITDDLNEGLKESEKLVCEVYGALNATEIGIVWLCNQYTDILLIIDYLKHMKLQIESGRKDAMLFLASNTTIATKFDRDPDNLCGKNNGIFPRVKGCGAVQISVHDKLKNRREAEELVEDIIRDCDPDECRVLYSSGEYDLIIQMPASDILEKMQKGGILNNAKKDKKGKYKKELRSILRNNTQLLLDRKEIEGSIFYNKIDLQSFVLMVGVSHKNPDNMINQNKGWEEWRELADKDLLLKEGKITETGISIEKDSNNSYYNRIRRDMEKLIRPSAGAIDMLDLLYADYLSTVSSAYNQTWVADFHYQFKGVLHAISLWIERQGRQDLRDESIQDRQWQDFSDLTNAFKQQVYHLSQSSRMVLDIPRCHFRMTGQYDLLVHTYYGFAKIILEVIYLMQGKNSQSDLVPLVTVNTVPQVKSELYFEYGYNDEMRVINLNIPASIIFDPQRGFRYLTHELFHYAVPQSREKRNYLMGCFVISECLKMQFIHIFNQMLYTSAEGTVDIELKKLLTEGTDGNAPDAFGLSPMARSIFFTNRITETNAEESGKYWLDDVILKFVQSESGEWRNENMAGRGEEDTRVQYLKKLFDYCMTDRSAKFFNELCEYLMKLCAKDSSGIFSHEEVKRGMMNNIELLSDIREGPYFRKAFDRLYDRFQYCICHKQYCLSQFTALRQGYARNKKPRRIIEDNLWGAVQEACCDIAMVSLTSMSLDDYLLFCIQAWRDSSCGDFDQNMLEEAQWLRCGFVYRHFSNNIWKNRELDSYKNDFVKKYAWFFTNGKSAEAGGRSDYGKWIAAYSEAYSWWECFMGECVKDFGISNKKFCVIPFYDTVFSKVLSGFDVNTKPESFKDTEWGKRLEEICADLRNSVYDKYNVLLNSILPDENEPKKESYVTNNPQVWSQYRNARIRFDLAVAQHFQIQKSFRELSGINRSMQLYQKEHSGTDFWEPEIPVKEKTAEFINGIWEFHVRSLEELLFYLQYCEKKMQNGNVKEPIWFRGQPDDAYKLVPSIMRNYSGERCKEYKSLRAYQHGQFEEFKHWADGAPEMLSGVRFTISDYLALMQHYFISTSLLDWSENAFSALYFALESYFESAETESRKNVSLYLLQPKKYNKIVREKCKVRRDELKKQNAGTWIENNIPYPEKWLEYSVPNLSTRQNEINFGAYLLGNIEFDDIFAACKESDNYERERIDNIPLCLPVAVRTSRLNARIQTQSGTFVAFNLYTLPEISKQRQRGNQAFDYISLEEVQKEMMRKGFAGHDENPVFLYKITIDHSCCRKVTEWLRGMGISRETVYPELELKKNRF